MNAFDRQVGLMKAISRLQPSSRKIANIFEDITPLDAHVLMSIYCSQKEAMIRGDGDREKVNVSEVRENFRGGAILPTSMSRSLKNLESADYIVRTTDENDARKKYVNLTERGYDRVATFERYTDSFWTSVYEKFGIERAKELTKEINALADVLDTCYADIDTNLSNGGF